MVEEEQRKEQGEGNEERLDNTVLLGRSKGERLGER